MKKKLGILLLLCLFVFMFTSCDEVLSVITEEKGGEKIVTNYVSMLEDTVYDESAPLKSWQDITLFKICGLLFAVSMIFVSCEKKPLTLGNETSMKVLLKASDKEITELVKAKSKAAANSLNSKYCN